MDVKKCFNALKKCNEIGKKMTPCSKYILINGMIIAYQNIFDKDDKDMYTAQGLNISFIDDKICKDLDALCYIPLLIDGIELYRISKEYEFNRFKIDDDFLYLIYRGLYTDAESFNDDFIKFAMGKGFNKSHIKNELSSNFNNDIDLYEIYINYKKTYKPKEIYKEFIIKCKILYKENTIINKSNEIIKDLLNCEYISKKELDCEIWQRILNSGKPVTLKFKENNNELFKIRLMKSLFKTATTSSKINIKLIKKSDNIYYAIINIINKGFQTNIIYKTIKY